MKAEFTDAKLTLRLISAVFAFGLAKDMFTGGLWIFSVQSVTGRIARVSTYPDAMAVIWVLLSVLVVPYVLMQTFGFGEKYSAAITRLSCRSILASGVIWAYLGFLSRNLDYQYVTSIFVINSLTCIAMSALMANGLNNAQKRAMESTS